MVRFILPTFLALCAGFVQAAEPATPPAKPTDASLVTCPMGNVPGACQGQGQGKNQAQGQGQCLRDGSGAGQGRCLDQGNGQGQGNCQGQGRRDGSCLKASAKN